MDLDSRMSMESRQNSILSGGNPTVRSRQRVEATVTAEISTMCLDMGDMQEALKAHDACAADAGPAVDLRCVLHLTSN